jgi:hypothetical protein
VTADNVRAIRPEVQADGDPVLTKEQLIQIATAPQLAVFR